MKKRALMNWSGGKDSALSLHHILQNAEYEVEHLLTSLNDSFKRVSMHGVREELLDQQAENIGINLVKLRLAETVSMEEYQAKMAETMQPLIDSGIKYSIFGDIFLEDLRKHREERLVEVGMKGVFPIWKRPSLELLDEFWDLGFKTIVVAINGNQLDKSFCGRILDRDFVKDLPSTIDPCGENGEFHTFVFEAPYFKKSIKFDLGETVDKTYNFKNSDGEDLTSTYFFTDLIPTLNMKEKHVADSCPRCGDIFTCKVNNVLQCDCMKLVLTKVETEYIANITEWEYDRNCLCNKCVLELQREFRGIEK